MTEQDVRYDLFAPTSLDAVGHVDDQAVLMMADTNGRRLCLSMPLRELSRAVALIASKRADDSVRTPLRVVGKAV